MTQLLAKTMTAGRAAVLALALGFVAMPLPGSAATLSFHFGINGGGDNFSYGIGEGGRKFKRDCLANREIRRGLRRGGFEDIRFVDRSGARVTVVAELGDDVWRLKINRCRGVVTDIKRIRS